MVERGPIVYEENVTPTVIELVADIIAAYVSNNNVPPSELGGLISGVHAALVGVDAPKVEETPAKRTPAVPVKKSVSPDGITCLFDGQTFKTLRRHLLAAHGMTPVEYRQAWGLDPDYPMVSEVTSKMRSEFAKSIGLGANASRRSARAKKPKA
jgi:predicted transcriptional regulator